MKSTMLWHLFIWLFYSADPSTWTKANVKEWLTWIATENQLKNFDLKKFSSADGHKLCQMTMRDLCRITEKPNAETIINHLSVLKRSNICIQPKSGQFHFLDKETFIFVSTFCLYFVLTFQFNTFLTLSW